MSPRHVYCCVTIIRAHRWTQFVDYWFLGWNELMQYNKCAQKNRQFLRTAQRTTKQQRVGGRNPEIFLLDNTHKIDWYTKCIHQNKHTRIGTKECCRCTITTKKQQKFYNLFRLVLFLLLKLEDICIYVAAFKYRKKSHSRCDKTAIGLSRRKKGGARTHNTKNTRVTV